MNTQTMTLEQQSFAAEHHNLVYAFLRDKKLRQDDFYDVVIFGYLRGVRKYLNRDDLRRRYAFSTIAWRAMESDLVGYYRAQSRPSRKVMTVSLEAMTHQEDRQSAYRTVSEPDWILDRLEAENLWDQVSGLFTNEQTELLQMRADGYTVREIASARRSPVSEVEGMFASMMESARELCLV
jgi:RNA polymerase sigma-70 factor (ECF subfamily)